MDNAECERCKMAVPYLENYELPPPDSGTVSLCWPCKLHLTKEHEEYLAKTTLVSMEEAISAQLEIARAENPPGAVSAAQEGIERRGKGNPE